MNNPNDAKANMQKTLLFDLDGTLIENSMDTFLPPYFGALTRKLADMVPGERLIEQLQASTRLMVANDDPARTNAEVFAADFFPKVGVASECLMPLLDEFYEREYRELRMYTKPVAAARAVLTAAVSRRHRIVIATAPLFPLRAVQQRLAWGDIADLPYALVTGYETMHACKPNPAYYAEIAARVRVAPADCIMIGNDVEMDILPARRAGMRTYWVTEAGEMATDVPTDWRGTLAEFGQLLASGALAESA